jgi:hypothetical protein
MPAVPCDALSGLAFKLLVAIFGAVKERALCLLE